MFKKLLYILLIATASILPQHITGSGTSGDPYVLYNAVDVDSIRYLGLSNKYYKLANDIDFTSFGDFSSISFNSVATGTFSFDGQGYKISNLVLVPSSSGSAGAGIFARLGDAAGTITFIFQNFTFDSCSAELTTQAAGNYAFILGSSPNFPVTIKNIVIENTTLDFTPTTSGGTWNCGFIVGQMGTSNSNLNIEDIYIDQCSLIVQPAGIPTLNIGAIIGNGLSSSNVYDKWAISNSYISGISSSTGAVTVGGLIGSYDNITSSISSIINNSYVVNTILIQSPSTLTTSRVGGLVGIMDIDNGTVGFDKCYTANLTITAATSRRGTIAGTIAYRTGGTVSFTDIHAETHTYNPVASASDFGGTYISDITVESVSDMKLQATYVDWDFTTIWDINSALNSGYPYLQFIPFVVVDILTPNGGEIIRYDSTYTITWNSSAISFDLYYSTNAGLSWTLIDTSISAQSYNWSVPNIYSDMMLIQVNDIDSIGIDESDAVFTLLPDAQINIFWPINQVRTINVSDTAQIKIESYFVNDLYLFWSNDSTTWYYIDHASVDTANGFFQDTTTYIWTFDGTVSGPVVWLWVKSRLDSNVYNPSRSYAEIGHLDGTVNICQSSGSSSMIESLSTLDLCCGWCTTNIWYINKHIRADGLSYKIDTNFDGPPYPLLDSIYLISGMDTTAQTVASFYGSPTQTVTYQGWLYYVEDSILYANDLINGIDSVIVTDLSPLYSLANIQYRWTDGQEYMQVYNVMWDQLSGEYLPADTTFENLNPSYFKPLLLVQGGTVSGTSERRVVAIELLEYPYVYADDIEQAYAEGTNFRRYYFRGIHPKAEKR